MDVLFLTQWYPSPDSPVSGIFVREHALAVARQHRVSVLHIIGMSSELSAIPPVTPIQDGPINSYVLVYPPGRLPKTTWLNRLKGVYGVVDALISQNARPDIVHAHIYNTADLACAIQWRYHIPAVLTEQSSAFPRKLIPTRQRWIARLCMSRMRLVMPVSKDLVTHIQRVGVRASFKVIPNTVNTDIFYPGDSKPSRVDGIRRILVVAGLTPVKGIDYLLPALARLKRAGRAFHLSIAGDGPERQTLTSMARDLGIGGEVTFLGNRTKPEVAELMRRSDFLALTSRWDNQPVVLLEAMASGLPVVASRIGGIPEVVSSEQGLLASVGDVDDIARMLDQMLLHYDDYPPERIAAYASSRFSHETVGELYSAAYRQVLGQNPPERL